MKKFLLFAAAAATMATASAVDAPTLTKVTDVAFTAEQLADLQAAANTRQGFGMNGKFYVQNKAHQQIYVYNADGTMADSIASSGSNSISHDEAGNLVITTNVFPGSYIAGEQSFIAITPDGTRYEYPLPIDEIIKGRMDLLGFIAGDMTGDATIFAQGAGTADNPATGTVGVFKINDGEMNEDESYLATADGADGQNSTLPIHAFTVDDEVMGLFVVRNSTPKVLTFDGDNLAATPIVGLPNKGASNGAQIFFLGEKTYIIYPTLPNYQDGFAIAELNEEYQPVDAETATVEFASTVTANPNSVQANWVYAEPVSETQADVYQYVPGLGLRTFTFEIPGEVTGVETVNSNKTVASVSYVNALGQVSAVPFQGMNIVVKTYTDGTKASSKVIK